MILFKTSQERRIYKSAVEPPTTAWLWLHTVNGVPTLKEYVNGKWTPFSGSSSTLTPSGTEIQRGYVTETALDKKLAGYAKTTALSEYAKSADVEGRFTALEQRIPDLSTVIAAFDTELKSAIGGLSTVYQPLLTAGSGISIDGNVISSHAELMVDGSLSPTSGNPVANKAVYAAFQNQTDQINDVNNSFMSGFDKLHAVTDRLNADKQDKLTAGSGIQIAGNVISTIGGGSGSGDGSGVNVAFVEGETPTDSGDVLYFFSHSLLQGVGSYNNLLQHGEEGGVTYHPAGLYLLNPAGNFIEVKDNDPENPIITVVDNRVYCYGQPTAMMQYGRVRVSHKIKHAETPDMAMLTAGVCGPFFAEKTRVRLTYDEAVITVQRHDGSQWQELPSGSYLEFTNDDFQRLVRLLIVKQSDETTASETLLTLNNGYEDTVVRVLFSEAIVLYKDGVSMNGFDAGAQSKLADYPDAGYFTFKNTGDVTIAADHDLDLSRFTLMYAKIADSGGSGVSLSLSAESPGVAQTTLGSNDANAYRYSTVNIPKRIEEWGFGVLHGPVHNARLDSVLPFTLKFSRTGSGTAPKITELGVLTLTVPF